jgi:hypothetical protein
MALRALKTEEEIAGIPLDQEILVELPGANTADELVVEKKAEIDPAAQTLQDQLEALKRESADRLAKTEREANERIAKAEREASELRTRSQSLEGDIINGGLAAAQSERDSAKAALKAAGEAGDWAAIADAQSKIGRAEAKILSFESGAAEIAERKEVKPVEQTRQVIDPVTAMQANPNLLPVEKEWLGKHQDALVGARNNELSVGYERAMKQGLHRGSAEYFSFLEDFMGYKKPDGDISVQAPPSRQERDGSGRPANNNVVRLTSEEREFAKNMGVTELEYAKNKQLFEAAKKADPDKYSNGR